jgi:hypothetical protein
MAIMLKYGPSSLAWYWMIDPDIAMYGQERVKVVRLLRKLKVKVDK